MAYINLLEIVYPVGSVYVSTTSTSPAEAIGGTWTQVKGAVLAATGANSFASLAYGGSLKISVNQMPSHKHQFDSLARYDGTKAAHATVGSADYSEYGDQWHQNQYATTSVGGRAELLALSLRILRLVQSGVNSFAGMW